ncbi:hypothetical protein GCM10009530_66960 [Microbispora corallina]|uniref:TlpA family protein disulfide reductase n=1 Tax=Microbispora corallina TaxID=83302 RepID=UPI0031E12407
MNALLWTVTVLGALLALAALAVALLAVRRCRDLYEVVSRRTARGPVLPEAGTPVPPTRVVTVDGAVVDLAERGEDERVLAFLTTDCPACEELAGGLRRALAALPAGAPRPLVVVSGGAAGRAVHVRDFAPVAHVADADGRHPLADALGVTAFPTVLVVSEGRGHRAGHGLAHHGLEAVR